MTDSVFDPNANDTTNSAALISSDPIADKLAQIKNEQGQPKYDTPVKAIDALIHSQEHIKTLEQEAASRTTELQTLREKAAQAEALEDIVKRLQQQNGNPQEKTPPAGMSEAQTVDALEKIVQKRELARVATANLDVVQSTLISKFGDLVATQKAVAAKAAELGISTQDLAALSSKSPKAALAYFGIDQLKTAQPTIPSQNTPLQPNGNITQPLERPKKSLLLGATSKEQAAFMKQVKDEVYKRMGVEV